MRRLLARLALAAPLVAPAAAGAAPPGEVPFSQLLGDVACVSATGAPDEVAVAGDDRRGRPGIRLLVAGPAGLAPAARVPLPVVEWTSRARGSFPADDRVRVSLGLRPARTVATIPATSTAALSGWPPVAGPR